MVSASVEDSLEQKRNVVRNVLSKDITFRISDLKALSSEVNSSVVAMNGLVLRLLSSYINLGASNANMLPQNVQ